jgi:hypothetical protein
LRLEIFIVVWTDIVDFRVMTPYSLVGRYQHFRGTYCLQLLGRSGPSWESDWSYRCRRKTGQRGKEWEIRARDVEDETHSNSACDMVTGCPKREEPMFKQETGPPESLSL